MTEPTPDRRAVSQITVRLGPVADALSETPEQAAHTNAAIRAWAKGDYGTEAIADIIIGTHLREHVIPFLDWDEEHTMARPDLRKLITADNAGKGSGMGTTAFLLAALCLNLWRGPTGSAYEVDLSGLWKLDMTNRQVVISALAKSLKITSL